MARNSQILDPLKKIQGLQNSKIVSHNMLSWLASYCKRLGLDIRKASRRVANTKPFVQILPSHKWLVVHSLNWQIEPLPLPDYFLPAYYYFLMLKFKSPLLSWVTPTAMASISLGPLKLVIRTSIYNN